MNGRILSGFALLIEKSRIYRREDNDVIEMNNEDRDEDTK